MTDRTSPIELAIRITDRSVDPPKWWDGAVFFASNVDVKEISLAAPDLVKEIGRGISAPPPDSL